MSFNDLICGLIPPLHFRKSCLWSSRSRTAETKDLATNCGNWAPLSCSAIGSTEPQNSFLTSTCIIYLCCPWTHGSIWLACSCELLTQFSKQRCITDNIITLLLYHRWTKKHYFKWIFFFLLPQSTVSKTVPLVTLVWPWIQIMGLLLEWCPLNPCWLLWTVRALMGKAIKASVSCAFITFAVVSLLGPMV